MALMASAAAGLYVVGALLVTGRGNVPLNEALDGFSRELHDAEAAWRRYRVRWGRWNLLRTALLAGAAFGFALAA